MGLKGSRRFSSACWVIAWLDRSYARVYKTVKLPRVKGENTIHIRYLRDIIIPIILLKVEVGFYLKIIGCHITIQSVSTFTVYFS